MNTSGSQTLKLIVQGILYQGGFGADNWKIFYQYAIDAIREINMFHSTQIKVTKVTVNTQTNTIDWPDDYLGFVYLGIPVNGRLWTLTRDNNIITTTTLVNGQETLTVAQGEGVIAQETGYFGYGSRGAKNRLYYTSDETNRRFIINGANPENILLAYISSGVEDEETLIPVKFKEAIIYYCRWKYYERDDVGQDNKADRNKDLYHQSISKLVAFDDPTQDEIYDALLETYSGTYQR